MKVGNYELVEPIGQGGMGEVWLARHRTLDRPCAIKLIRTTVIGGDARLPETLLKRFEREARATSRLSSPHTVRLYDFGVAGDGTFYYVMELLDGLDLQTLVERHGPIEPERAIAFVRQACESLAEAHHVGLVHRDIKPSNLITCRAGLRVDHVKVLDFGLVKSLEPAAGNTELTRTGVASGSPAFMAPELVLEKPVDQRTDIYALGCVAYWLVSGRLVFEEAGAIKTLMAHVDKPAPVPSEASEQPLPEGLDEIILGCLEKDPALRPANVDHLVARLDAVVLARPWSAERAQRWWQVHMPASSRIQWPVTNAELVDSEPQPSVAPGRGDALAEPLSAASLAAPAAPPVVKATLAESRVPRPRSAPLEAQRERAVARLQGAFGRGDLTMSEFDERLELAQRARGDNELAVLTADLPRLPAEAPPAMLPAVVEPAPLPAASPVAAEAQVPATAKQTTTITSIFSGARRRGTWVVPQRLRIRTVFGGVKLDLREARWSTDAIDIHCTAVFGGVHIIVPPGVRVDSSGHGVFGEFVDDEYVPEEVQHPRVVRLSGIAVFGGVRCEVQLPSRKERKRRLRLRRRSD